MFAWPTCNPEGLGYPVSQVTKASWNIWPVKKKHLNSFKFFDFSITCIPSAWTIKWLKTVFFFSVFFIIAHYSQKKATSRKIVYNDMVKNKYR